MTLSAGWLPVWLVVLAVETAPAMAAPARAGGGDAAGQLPDRPIVWREHDDRDVPRPPKPNRLQDLNATLLIRDSLPKEIDRVLHLGDRKPAEDVNALDEVACSTWFCPRNHLEPMSPEAVAAGPPAAAPRLPLRVVRGKDKGATLGFQVTDADGRPFLVKLDPAGHAGLATGAEMVGQRLYHAAGYNVPGAFLMDLGDGDLALDADATFLLYEVQKRPLTIERLAELLGKAARLPDGKLRAVAVPWIPGRILGGFDMLGQRSDDPNDRIPHEHRRSLRASWMMCAWTSNFDPSTLNTLDSYVEEDGRRFVRHYFIDFGASLGSVSVGAKGPHRAGEYGIEVGRTLTSLVSLGFYRRPYQGTGTRAEWAAFVEQYPAAGWFPAEGFDPDAFRTNRKVPAHMRQTDRDLYWGAKVVTSFSDEQIAAVVATAGMPDRDAAYVERALKARRDIIGRRYLGGMTALERPETTGDGSRVCFDDLMVARGYLEPAEARYAVEVTDGGGIRIAATEVSSAGEPRTCVTVPARRPAPANGAGDDGYRVVRVAARTPGAEAGPGATRAAARIHLRWREAERRFVVVGLERDETPDGRHTREAPPPVVARAALGVPLVTSRVLFWPIVKAAELIESRQLLQWLNAITTSDDGLIGVRPAFLYATGFVPIIGAHLFNRRTVPGGELGARLMTGGPSIALAEITAASPAWLGLSLLAQWDRRNDRLFAGIGPSSREELEAQGRDLSRYRSDNFALELRWDRRLTGPLRTGLHGDVRRRDYGSDGVRGGEPVAAFWGLSPAGCAELGLPAGCVDPMLVPGFNDGLRIAHAGAAIALDTRSHARDGAGVTVTFDGTYGHGVGGDPSRHVYLSGNAVAALGGYDRTLLLRLQGAMVERLTSAPVPFDELVSPSGVEGMRGFQRGRFRGESGLVGSAEYRWLVSYYMDASMFVDVGTVAGRRFQGLSSSDLFPSFGLGLRLVRPIERYWEAQPLAGFQVAYSLDGGFRFLLAMAPF